MRVVHRVAAVVFSSVVAVAGVASAGSSASSATGKPAQRAGQEAKRSARLEKVSDRSLVCMVNDRYFGREQIAVEVSGKTYYGCCAMCKERLAKDEAARTAVDPVSGEKVDKSAAIIGRASDDTVVYFENLTNFKKYNTQK
jgi:YHS domain-containing protein